MAVRAIGATATGIVFVTLAISYFVPAASALADARQLGEYVSSLGETPVGGDGVRSTAIRSGQGAIGSGRGVDAAGAGRKLP